MKKELKITVIKSGPYGVSGNFKLVLPDGIEKELDGAHLCRCGESKNRPFCDGSHQKINFEK